MSKITITRPVIVKIRVTENYKRAAAAGLQASVARLDAGLRQLEGQAARLRSLEKQNPAGVEAAGQKLDAERRACLQKRQELLEELKNLGRLAPGDEVVHARVESIVDVQVGDDWRKLMGAEIVLEDGIVVEIRTGGKD